jgi:hypothetical protein
MRVNWSNIKNIIIALLVLINAFLLGDTAYTRYKSNSLPKGLEKSVVSILEKNDITIEENLLKKRYEERDVLNVEFYSADELSKMLLGEKVEYKSDGDNIIAEKDGAVLKINGSSFTFETPLTKASSSGRKKINALKKAGFSSEGMVFEDETVKMKFSGLFVEGMSLSVQLDSDGNIAYLSGTWGKVTESGEKEKVTFASTTPRLLSIIPTGAHIKNIESVYVIEGSGQNYNVKAAWSVTADDEKYIVS